MIRLSTYTKYVRQRMARLEQQWLGQNTRINHQG
jgi:hypothetical protein